MKVIFHFLEICLDIIFARIIPCYDNRVYFRNIWGQYNDNTKALAECYHFHHPDYIIFYEFASPKCTNNIPSYITPVFKHSLRSKLCLYSSRVVIDNDWGAIKKSGKGLKGKLFCLLVKKTISRKALYISTGHGTPLKRIGLDSLSETIEHFVTSSQYMFVLDNHSKHVYERITNHSLNGIIVSGSPRNDILFDSNKIREIRQKNNTINKRIALFAPTFRSVNNNGTVEFIGLTEWMEQLFDHSDLILQSLKNKFGGDWIIGLRLHPGASIIKNVSFNDKVFNANQLLDMADCLAISDCLITDYSSCLFDLTSTITMQRNVVYIFLPMSFHIL